MMAVIFSIQNYRPIRKLASIINVGRTSQPSGNRKDELTVISEADECGSAAYGLFAEI